MAIGDKSGPPGGQDSPQSGLGTPAGPRGAAGVPKVKDPLRCAQCGQPFARLQGGSLVIQSVHGGEKHYNWVSVWDLVLLVVKGLSGELG